MLAGVVADVTAGVAVDEVVPVTAGVAVDVVV